MSRPIVLSGLGVVCPQAADPAALWKLCLRDGLAPTHPPGGAPLAPERIPEAMFEKQPAQLRHMDRLGRLSLAATTLALADSGLEAPAMDPLRTGIVLGSGYGCLSTNEEYLEGILERGARYGNPVVFQNTVTNAATGYISMVHNLRGPTATLCSGWAAGLEALRFGCHQIQDGQAERMVVGSADTLSPKLLEGLSLPWDGPRVSEAACTLVLEERSQAHQRGAHLYAEIAGTGHRRGPLEAQARTLARAVRDAVSSAQLQPGQLDAVFSSANGPREFDRWERSGLHTALGAQAERMPVSCPKTVLGETFSAAGTLAVLLAALALDTGWVPSTPGGARMDPEWVLVTALDGDGSALAVVLHRCRP
jgi:3-oxoacyl-(acyl-carrier-protein) synthase